MVYGLIFALLAATLCLMAVVRLAPSDPAVWHIPLAETARATPGPCADQVRAVPKGARAACLLPGTPGDLLARLATAALATPRTTTLAGTPAEGRITWITRSRLMGYPDYLTAEAIATPEGTRLDLHSRQRFGNGDWGVNAARLRAWLARL